MKYFIALVIKAKLRNGNTDIPDILFVQAEDKDDAIRLVASHEFEDAVWIQGKSVCRISKILDITRLHRNSIVPLHSEGTYQEFVRRLQTTAIPSGRRRRRKKVTNEEG
jgi:hypothetical protein